MGNADGDAGQSQYSKPWKITTASIVGSFFTQILYPLEVVKLRFQAGDQAANNMIPKYNGILDAVKTVYRKEGVNSLFRGVVINGASNSLASAIFFYLYQEGKIRYKNDQNNPLSWNTVFVSLRASTICMAITTPLWAVKTRMALF